MNFSGYDLSRKWFDFCFVNPEKIRPIHSAIYFFAIEHCNRLGWKEKFGFPSQMVMEAIGVKNWRTYQKALQEIIDFGFIKMIEKSKNQYSSNIIAIVKNTKATTKALDKALQKHSTKQGQSTVSINKQRTNNKEQITKQFNIFWDLYHDITKKPKTEKPQGFKYFKKLNKTEMESAIDNIQKYYDSVSDKAYLKKAYTYLRDKSFNNEFEVKNNFTHVLLQYDGNAPITMTAQRYNEIKNNIDHSTLIKGPEFITQ